MRLPDNAVHVWMATCDSLRDSALLRQYQSFLDSDDVARQRRLRSSLNRHRDLIARALLRTTLSHYVDCPPGDWRFVVGVHGKPDIAGDSPPLRFNLSHSGDRVACAVAAAGNIGIDIEQIGRKNNVLRIARRYFSVAELRQLEKQSVEEQLDAFYDYWTLKEACLKARGGGIALGLKNVSFDLSSERHIGIGFSGELDDDTARWRCWLLDVATDYRLALAWRPERPAEPVTVELMHTVPGRSIETSPSSLRRVMR